MAITNKDFADELRIEGISYKGFGVIPKAVTLHKGLTIEAKAIYSYFASFSGGGSCAFPSRDKILSDLRISKNRYYKHFNMLITLGLIHVQEEKVGTRFSRNIYTLKSLAVPQAEGSIAMSGTNALGYGIIPKAVVLDSRLPIEAKGIYAYYAAFTGAGNECSPKRNDVLYHLSLSSERYSKYRDILEELGYITVSQTHKDGLLSSTKISLSENPAISEDKKRIVTVISSSNVSLKNQSSENRDTEENEENQHLEEISNNQSPENEDTENQSPENEDTENEDTNNNNINNNNLNSNKIKKREDKKDLSLSTQENERTEDALFAFESPVGNISLSKNDAKKLSDTFENIEGLYELAICSLNQRKTLPKSIFHFIWELGLTKNWKKKVHYNHNNSTSGISIKSEEDKLLEKWEQEDQADFEARVIKFMKDEDISDYSKAVKEYTARSEKEVREKLNTFLRR